MLGNLLSKPEPEGDVYVSGWGDVIEELRDIGKDRYANHLERLPTARYHTPQIIREDDAFSLFVEERPITTNVPVVSRLFNYLMTNDIYERDIGVLE